MTDNKWRAWIGPVALLAYTAFLVVVAVTQRRAASPGELSVWEMQNPRRLASWVMDHTINSVLEVLRFLPLGILAALALPRFEGRRTRFLLISALGILLALVLSFMVRGFDFGQPWESPGSLDVFLPWLGSMLGVWMGVTWLQGWRARLWFIPKLVFVVLMIVGGFVALLFMAIEKAPADFEGARVTSAEKRRLFKMIQQNNSMKLQPGQTGSMRLTEHDLDVLLAWGLSLTRRDQKAKVDLGPGSVGLNVSAGFPSPGQGHQYMNLSVQSDLMVYRSDLDLKLTRIKLGRVEAPDWVLGLVSPVLATTIRHDRRVRPFLKSTEDLTVEPGGVRLTYGKLDLPEDFMADLAGPGMGKEVGEATGVQIRNLIARAGKMPRGERRFGACLETAFALAQTRSASSDPVTENQAATFALAIVLGHPGLAKLIGPDADGETIIRARRSLKPVTIRGRDDWTKHFLVSAALALLSHQAVSDAAGLLKEELDAGKGGSGFSFPDLLADRTGTTFALTATRSAAAARSMQDRLGRGFRIDDFFPPAADLPEGMSDATFQRTYGGVGGKRYRRIVSDIERRIAACDAYRASP